MDLDKAAKDLENRLTGALVRSLRRQDALALAYSGGLDSTVLARILSELADVDVFLVTVGMPDSRDVVRARRNARFLRMPLIEVSVGEATLRRDLPVIVPLVGATPVDSRLARRWGIEEGARRVSPVLVGVQAALFAAFAHARRHARRVVLGQGADELFGGYRRYESLTGERLRGRMQEDLKTLETVARPVEARVAAHHGVAPDYPYLDARVKSFAQTLPPELLIADGRRKLVLRRLAERLGLPTDVVDVPKTAAQYGSGIAELLRVMAQREGLRQAEYLQRFLAEGAASRVAAAPSEHE
jgi:asparagine synthase (glutamine-hydrolysing)